MGSVELGGIFPQSDPLKGITALDVGPDIAGVLGLPLSPEEPPNLSSDNWPEPEPLAETLPDVMQFDLELMPESLRPLVKDVAERMQVPLDFPAVTAIATLAGVVNRRAIIQPKRNDHTWIVVPNLWGGIIAPPGMMKRWSCMKRKSGHGKRSIRPQRRKISHGPASRNRRSNRRYFGVL